ncbi:MAG: hypothetical protein COS42_03385, partial [Flavobacteriales bacterium CG03_land_8_20_14_0_80_35_15]
MKNKITFLVLLLVSFGFAQTKPNEVTKPNKTLKTNATVTLLVDGNWSLGANWSGGSVPTSGDDVIIPNGLTLFLNITNAVANSLTVDNGGVMQISTGQALTVTNGFVNNGTFTIKSNVSSSGSFITGTSSGSITYERFLAG